MSKPVDPKQRFDQLVEGDPKWLEVAFSQIGQREIKGAKHNPQIIAYHAATSLKAQADETPWCSAFVNWCFEQAGVKGTRLANARSFAQWGLPYDKPLRGCVAVFTRKDPKNPDAGHVGFFLAETSTHVVIVGGNQGDSVSISPYPKHDERYTLLGYRMPPPAARPR